MTTDAEVRGIPFLHYFLVPAGPLVGSEWEAACGGVVEGDTDAPQVYRGPVLLLVVLPQHSPLVHVRVLAHTHTHTHILFSCSFTTLIPLNPSKI